jgi:hypothetical protein
MAEPEDKGQTVFSNEDRPAGFAPADSLVKKVDDLRRTRDLLERQWKLNLAFYKGKQYVFYNRKARRIESLPTDEGDKPRYRVRLVSNQIAPNTQSLLSRLVKSKPQFFATPGSTGFEAQKAAEVAENLLEYWWDKFHLTEKREEAMLWAIICGNGFWKITWDDKAGPGMRVMLNPETGEPIVNPLVQHLFEQRLEQAGIDSSEFERRVYQGEIRVDVMSPFEVLLDDTAQVFEDCKYAICAHSMSTDEIQKIYGVRLKPNAVNRYPDETLPGAFGNLESKVVENVREIFYGYFLPGEKYPEGRFVVFTKNPSIVLYDAPWPYPFEQLPLVKFPGMRIPGQLWDGSVVEQALPLQKELNRTLSQVIEYKNLTLKPQMLAPVGSLRQRITDEPGAIFEYNPVAGKVPESIPLPSLPPYVYEHLQDLGNRLKDIFGLNEIMEGSVPPNVEAGVAIDLLQEAATDRLAPQILLMEKSLERAGNQMLQLAQKYYQEPRMMIITGSGSKPKIEQFEDADLIKGVSVKVEAGSGLPRTRAGRQARVLQMLQLGVISPAKAYKYLDMADFKSLQMQFEADEEQAMREHDKLLDGGAINEQAAAQAEMQVLQMMQQAQQQVDPNTGQPMVDPNTGQPVQQGGFDPAMLEQLASAGMQPLPYENKSIHLETHAAFMKSAEFEGLPPDAKERFYKHFELTQQALAQETGPQGQAPKVSLQLRGALGPTVGSKILNQSGVKGVTPEELLEPPLDTVVIDNKDKPNAPDANANQQDLQSTLSKMQESEMMHQQKLRQQQEMEAAKVVV